MSLPSARRGSGIVARSERRRSNDFKATSDDSVADIDSDFFNLRNPPSPVAPQFSKPVALRTQYRALNSPATLCLLTFLIGNDAQLDVSPQELTEKALWLATAEADDFPAIKAHLVTWIDGHLIW